MHAADSDDRLAFAPPPPPGLLRAFVLAVFAHLLLLLALTYGLRWQRETPVVAVEAELWAKLPVEAAPKAEPPPPPPPPALPVVQAPPLPDPQVQRDAEIALEREREKREAAQRRQAELEQERDRKRKLEAKRKRDEEQARQKQEKLDRQEQARLLAEAKRKDDDRKRRQQVEQEQQERKLAQLREENMKRMQGMAGTGAPGAAGTAARSSGPSASWAGKVQARVRPNIVFADDLGGNPKAEVEVRTAPDGTIVGKRLMRSSGSRAWDDAVLRALDKTEVLPRDIDGRVPSPVVIEFRPRG